MGTTCSVVTAQPNASRTRTTIKPKLSALLLAHGFAQPPKSRLRLREVLAADLTTNTFGLRLPAQAVLLLRKAGMALTQSACRRPTLPWKCGAVLMPALSPAHLLQ